MVEVNQLRKKKTIFFIILGRIKQKTKQMLLKGGVATPSTPPLDPPMIPQKELLSKEIGLGAYFWRRKCN